ncbi:MAG: pyrophosphatase [Micromonosporaceae bacterium]|nr:pyrophosphatase [Micromonosporaceae bacterium]
MQLAELSDQIEAVSHRYADTYGIDRSETWFLLKLHEEVGELTQAFLMRSGQARPKGMTAQELDERLQAELADVLSHVLLMARHLGVDLEAAVDRKWLLWNRGRAADAGSGAE